MQVTVAYISKELYYPSFFFLKREIGEIHFLRLLCYDDDDPI